MPPARVPPRVAVVELPPAVVTPLAVSPALPHCRAARPVPAAVCLPAVRVSSVRLTQVVRECEGGGGGAMRKE